MSQHQTLFDRACQSIPGGVNSPVRAFKGVGGTPIFFKAGRGPYLIDVEDREYVDYVGSWGPLILGHAHPEIIQTISETVSSGTSFGAPTLLEIQMAEQICAMIPSIQKVRMVNSGTEATMTALRLARGITKRDKIIKFEGCYHGHEDALLVKAGSGLLTLGLPSSPGVPNSVAEHTVSLPYNDLEAVQQCFETYADQIAAVIIEPIAGNMNLIPPSQSFMDGLREITKAQGALLIFDEVMTGFRVHPAGAQALYQIEPDLTTLGKVIGGGLPVGAIGGKAEYMDHLAPVGPIYQAGTLSGNPLAMAVGLATLKHISKPNFYTALFDYTERLCTHMKEIADKHQIPFTAKNKGSMFGFFFTDNPNPKCFQDVLNSNQDMFKAFFHLMLENGVYLAPSAFEAGFVSAAHNDESMALTLSAAEKAFSQLQ